MYTLILNGSPRKNGDTRKLIDMVTDKLNSDFKVIDTFFEDIKPCNDCRRCHSSNSCSINDDMTKFFDDIISADNIILASPLHYSMFTSSLLSCVSRFQYFFVSKYIRKDETIELKKKRGYLILTGGGATKDFYPIEKVSKLILRQINATLEDSIRYIDTDDFPLAEFDRFDEERKKILINEVDRFVKNF